MNNFKIILSIIFLLTISTKLFSQNIENKLGTDNSSSSFDVTNNSGASILKVTGDKSIVLSGGVRYSINLQNNDYSLTVRDFFVYSTNTVDYNYTLPTAASAGAGKVYRLYGLKNQVTALKTGSDIIIESTNGTNVVSITNYQLELISDGISTWFQL